MYLFYLCIYCIIIIILPDYCWTGLLILIPDYIGAYYRIISKKKYLFLFGTSSKLWFLGINKKSERKKCTPDGF